MFTVPSFMRSPRKSRPPMAVEGLEGRVLFAFNAYIAGGASGVQEVPVDFVFSTTGQAAKQWVIDWGDDSGLQTVLAPNQTTGFTSPHIESHTYHSPFDFPVTATATSITNVTATAVPLGENSAFGNAGSTGKTVQVLPDSGSVGTNIDSVVDDNNNTYVLTVDGKRMAVTRFKPDGTLGESEKGSEGVFADADRHAAFDPALHRAAMLGRAEELLADQPLPGESPAVNPEMELAAV